MREPNTPAVIMQRSNNNPILDKGSSVMTPTNNKRLTVHGQKAAGNTSCEKGSILSKNGKKVSSKRSRAARLESESGKNINAAHASSFSKLDQSNAVGCTSNKNVPRTSKASMFRKEGLDFSFHVRKNDDE